MVKSLADIKKEEKAGMKIINDLKKNITDIKEENIIICEKIKELEEQLHKDDLEDESEGQGMYRSQNAEMENEIEVEN